MGGRTRNALSFVREVGETASLMWWSFFDWLAQVPMRQLVVTWVLALLLSATPLLHPRQNAGFVHPRVGRRQCREENPLGTLEPDQTRVDVRGNPFERHSPIPARGRQTPRLCVHP